jgi:hypothetical protein
MTLIRSPFDTKPKFAISSELKISDTKRKANNVKQKNGALLLRNAALPRAQILMNFLHVSFRTSLLRVSLG